MQVLLLLNHQLNWKTLYKKIVTLKIHFKIYIIIKLNVFFKNIRLKRKLHFYSKSNSEFIEEMYVKYIENDHTLPSGVGKVF